MFWRHKLENISRIWQISHLDSLPGHIISFLQFTMVQNEGAMQKKYLNTQVTLFCVDETKSSGPVMFCKGLHLFSPLFFFPNLNLEDDSGS